MSGGAIFVLPSPWALFDPKADEAGYGRKALDPTRVTELRAGRPVYLAAPAGCTVYVSGYKMAAQPFGRTYRLGDVDYALYLLSAGVRPNENRLEIEVDGAHAGGLMFKGHIARPTFTAGRDNTDTPEARAEILDGFLLSIVNLIQMTSDPNYDKYQIVWDRLQFAWDDEEAENTVPPMALIVRHADKYATLIGDLLKKPRQLLRRKRELTTVDHVQQLDVSCVRWLSRQPGRTVYERAGPRQRIMAVQRYESVDTLENRVLMDYAMRAHREATQYTRTYEKLHESQRWRKVDSYGRRCRHTRLDLAALDVSRLSPPVVPNFVLLQDARYRYLWRAYLEIRRRQDEEDECWRWQHRLWSDYVRLIMHLSLRKSDEFERIAETPLRISAEQFRGVWTMIGAQSASWAYRYENGEDFVISLVWDANREHPKVKSWLAGLGCNTFLHVARLSDNEEGYIAIWGYHGYDTETEDIESLALSGARALERAINLNEVVFDEAARASGLIVVSQPYGPSVRDGILGDKRLKKYATAGDVAALRIGPSRGDIKSAEKWMGEIVPMFIRRMFVDK